MLQRLIKEVVDRYAEDPSCAGVLVSWIEGSMWYMSIQRYKKAYGEGKTLVVSERNEEWDVCLMMLVLAFCEEDVELKERILG